MTAQIIDGKALAEELRQGFKARVEALTAKGHKPGLVVILVGEDAASQVYVKNKVNGCLAIGMHSEKITYEATVDQETVLNKIAELNADPNIHGILVQLPLPKHFDEEKVLEAAIEAGADDVESDMGDGDENPGSHQIWVAVENLHEVARELEKTLGEAEGVKLAWKPSLKTEVSADDAATLLKLIDVLDDDDDVQTVWGNYDISDEVREKRG